MTRDVLYGIAPGLTYFAAVGAAVACGGGPWWGVVGVYVIAVVWAGPTDDRDPRGPRRRAAPGGAPAGTRRRAAVVGALDVDDRG
jgi:hypothetical protein